MRKLMVWWFKVKGWKIGGTVPATMGKGVVVASPHTSNWDFVYCMAVFTQLGLPVRFLGKKELFKWPLKNFLYSMGGMPVIRSRHTKLVDSIVELFAEQKDLLLLIPAEGTRGWVKQWKSGFYHVAVNAQVPVLLGYLDYRTKTAGFGPLLHLTGNKVADAATIRNFYADKTGRHPERFNLDAIYFD